MRLGFLILLTFAWTADVWADIVPSPAPWTVTPNFEKNADAREALSGAACAHKTGHCLAVNDEKRYAQFFDIVGRTIEPKEVIGLLSATVGGIEMDEIDAEGAAYVPATQTGKPSYFYVIGSHGLSRNGELQLSRFSLIRFPVDASTGRPTFSFNDDNPTPDIERSADLRATIKNIANLAAHAEQRLDRNGVTIEGIAFTGDDTLFGLRSPCESAHALIMRVPTKELFSNSIPTGTTKSLGLGDNVGVRDLAKVNNGILILAGRSDDNRGDQQFTCGEQRTPPKPVPSIWFWSGKDADDAKPLGILPGIAPGDSAETLLLLGETDVAYRVLVLFDGVSNGGPVEFSVDK
ncbi:DUF3616 domain-containing protein [Rhizobium sp. IBUN]|uniref:DUF3616 domain-containing protein n=1 Tax=Rhizobium sp. IBUN TaxID=1042326 RepID=UPI0003F8A79F|nr:DUF3616 domain-containing protein [Rhizobium sp. IBUN]